MMNCWVHGTGDQWFFFGRCPSIPDIVPPLLISVLIGELVSAILQATVSGLLRVVLGRSSKKPLVLALSQLAVLALALGELSYAITFWSVAALIGSVLELAEQE